MKLEKWALIAEIVGAAAIVISLVFVGLEIRSNTQAAQAATFQASVAYDVELLLGQGRDADTARAYIAWLDDPDSLSGGERAQAALLSAASVRHMENLYLQYEAGMLSDEAWSAREQYIRNGVNRPGHMRVLENSRNWSGPFLEYVGAVQSSTPDQE
jgi:hypothetical protein